MKKLNFEHRAATDADNLFEFESQSREEETKGSGGLKKQKHVAA